MGLLLTISWLNQRIIKDDNIYLEIINQRKLYEKEVIDGIIVNNTYFIPGIKGRKVNVLKSYYQMKKSGYYNSNHFIFDDVNPIHSLEDNTLVILRGNSSKKAIAIIGSFNDSYITKEEEYLSYPHLINVIFLNKSNYLIKKDSIVYGDIIFLESDINISEYKYLITYFNNKGFKIMSLSNLLSE